MKWSILVFFISTGQFLSSVRCDEHLRPAAIIPWSQYQRRLNKAKETGIISTDEGGSHMNSDSMDTYLPSSYSGNYEKVEKQLLPNERFSKLQRPQYRIRPQIKGRLPAEPSDFIKQQKMSTDNEKEYLPNVDEELHKTTFQKIRNPNRGSIKMQPTVVQSAGPSRVATLAIPNGVPMYAGNWDEGQPHYTTDRKPMIHAANTFSGAETVQLSQLPNVAPDIIGPVYQKADSNLVNSIFSQSQARVGAIPTLPQQSQTQAYFEKLLTDGNSLNQISNIAKNWLGVGGQGGGSESSGGFLETMTSALRGAARLPTSSAAHDAQDISAVASRPQPSVLQNFLSQAVGVINDSMKQKQLKDKAEEAIKVKQMSFPEPSITPTGVQKTSKLSKDQENSLKLLGDLPEEQRKMLEAAIMSGEIDANSAAIKTLVKDDLTEDSKKEKESRLLEWLRTNRPTKSSLTTVVADKLPYYGRYLGTFAEAIETKKQLKPSGALWLIDEKRLLVSKFIFEPGSLLKENVTFWLGPNKASGNVLQDIVPSENGFYVKPKPIDMSMFASGELPPIEAKLRENVASIKFLAGVPPIVANNSILRVKRNENRENKPIELLVEGGVMQLKPGPNDRNGIDFDVATTSLPPIHDGFRLRQPEFDKIDENAPQPLEWYTGFQPLLLTLPDSKVINDLNWVALRDHRQNATLASILLPNGPVFQVPKIIQLRPFSPNGLDYNISSGSIQILDMKTIKINDFSFQNNDDSVWFMMGKDILPNTSGNIIPIFDEKSKTFDCQALKSYHKETLVLRLPGKMDMKDVFWFSVFSMKKMVSYSHMYLPYNDMQLIPDLSSIPTPSCKYKPAN